MVLLVLLPACLCAQTVKSPNGNVWVKFSLTEDGVPTYEMFYKHKTVIKPSHLGLELAKSMHASKGMDETSLMDGFTETSVHDSTFDETWKPVWGETSTIRNHYKKPILINSAYRTVAYNKRIGGSSQSQHCKGTAADIRIEGVEPLQLALYIKSLPFFKNRGGIGLYDRSAGIYAGFVHVDVRNYKSRWISKVGTAYISTPNLMPTLKRGMRDGGTTSYAVTVLQRHLGIKNPDGIFGAATEAAVITWQKNHGLAADGVVGEKTWLTL